MKAILKDTGELVDIISVKNNIVHYSNENFDIICYRMDENKCLKDYFESLFERKYDLFKSVLSAMIGNKDLDIYSEEQHDEIIKTSLIITNKALKALNND